MSENKDLLEQAEEKHSAFFSALLTKSAKALQ